jgi:DNA-binding MarR family transcriptional regulator
MDATERNRTAEALLNATQALVAIAVRTVAAGPAEVTVVQHRVLVLLGAHGTLTVTALAEALGVDQSNASRHCTRLAHLGLVSRTRAPHDGRAVEVRLSADGRRQVRAVRRARRAEIGRVLDRMPDDAVVAATRAFEEFDRAAGAVPETPAPLL